MRASPGSCPRSDFSDPRLAWRTVRHFPDFAAPPGTVCSLLVQGWRERAHAVYVTRDHRGFAAMAIIDGASAESRRYEASLDDNIGPMIERICKAAVTNRAYCYHTGLDGTNYLLAWQPRAQAGRAAFTWSPRPGTDSDMMVTMFLALRAYLAAAPDVQPLAYHTLYTEVYEAYNVLVVSSERRRN